VKTAAAAIAVGSLIVSAAAAEAKRAPVDVRVLTRNLYLGTNLDRIVQAKSAPEAFGAAEVAWRNVQLNNFPVRARAIAREIAATRPDFVGLQEVTLYRTQSPADFTVTPATTVALDYVRELRRALAERKLPYRVLVLRRQVDAELPTGDPPAMDVRLTLGDALLVRNDKRIRIRRIRSGTYTTTTSLFGGFITARRGFVYADVTIGGRTFRVIDTHLESFSDTSQIAQGTELAAGPANTRLPTILLGDLNSRADGTGTPTYANLRAAGFRDAWADVHPTRLGLTCCFGELLTEPGGPFYSRIDYVLHKNGFRAVAATVVGEEPRDRLAGLWPSDHAGVFARLRLP
jgi:endonuclease/exonuclease/phosphatase family metal-dependent hydrolase